MKRAIILQHTPTEGPERIAELLAERGYTCDVRHVYAGDAVPRTLEPGSPLVLMGGPMGVGDVGDDRYPFLQREITLLRGLVPEDHPILGICLGAQLLAAGAGARVYPNTRPGPDGKPTPAREVGWGPVGFLGIDREPALSGMREREMVLHWHGDTFDLPGGAVLLASTPVCRNQAFRLGHRQFGLQFHCELGMEAVKSWIHLDAAYVRETLGDNGADAILGDTVRYYGAARAVWERLLGNVIGEMVQK